MSARLQVHLTADEMERLKVAAARDHISVSAWVRRVLRVELARTESSMARKLNAIAKAIQFNGPTADIDQMNHEIEVGYSSGLP